MNTYTNSINYVFRNLLVVVDKSLSAEKVIKTILFFYFLTFVHLTSFSQIQCQNCTKSKTTN